MLIRLLPNDSADLHCMLAVRKVTMSHFLHLWFAGKEVNHAFIKEMVAGIAAGEVIIFWALACVALLSCNNASVCRVIVSKAHRFTLDMPS